MAGPLNGITETWSKLRAGVVGMPSVVVKTTALSRPRAVVVAGSTTSSLSPPATLSRAGIATGRRLSGGAKVYHRISPRRIELVPALRLPGEARVVGVERARLRRTRGVSSRVAGRVVGAEGTRHGEQSQPLGRRQLADKWPNVLRGEVGVHR